MDLIDERCASASAVRPRNWLLRAVPWLIPLLVGVIGPAAAHLPLATILRYDGYFAVCVVLPGVLILRAVWRSTGNWAEDAGLGAAVGIAFQLVGWALVTSLGAQRWLLLWPLGLCAVFAVVRPLRKHWRIEKPAPLPLAWSWGVALALAVLLFGVVTGPMVYHVAPHAGTAYHQDLLYHLSMVHELMRSAPPQLPQVAGESLDYHWFANADMAAAVDITGISPALVLFRLWLMPLVVVAVLVTAVLARQVSRVWWTGALAAVMLAVPSAGALFGLRRTSVVGTLIYYPSPSQTFALVALTAAAVFLVDALYRCGGRGAWVLAMALAMVGGGSKPTVLPILAGGVGLAGLYLLLRKHAVPWRSLLAFAGLAAAAAVAMLTVTGSTGGSGFRLLAVVRTHPGYKAVTGDSSLVATGGWLLPSLADGQFAGFAVLLGVVLLAQLGLLVGFGLLASRSTRTDPVGWFLLGGLTAGWLAFLIVDHPSSSEYYFIRVLVPFAAVAAAWMAAVAVRGRDPRPVAVLGSVSVLLGVLVVWCQSMVKDPTVGSGWAAVQAVSRGLVVAAVGAFLVRRGWRKVLRHRPGMAGMGMLVPVVMVVGMALAGTVGQATASRASQEPLVYTSKNLQFTPNEQAAAAWLNAHSAPDTVVATNTACWPNRRDCVSLGYLVSGLAGRRAMLEGWAYTQEAMARHGAGGRAYMTQPAPWHVRWALTRQLFTAPTPELLQRLRNQYGVRWIFVDRASGRKTPAGLDRLATLRYENPEVSIYEVAAPGT